MSDWRREVKKDSPFLYHFDIEDNSPVECEIAGYERMEAYCPGKGEKGTLWCLKFRGAKKMLGINVTNGNLIEHVLGTADKEKWVGKRIILRVAECAGDKCIRIHAPGAKLPKQCKRFEYLDADPRKKSSAKPGGGGDGSSVEPASIGGNTTPSGSSPSLPVLEKLLAGNAEITRADFDTATAICEIEISDMALSFVSRSDWRGAISQMVRELIGGES